MKLEQAKSIIESMLFSAGRVVKISEFAKILEMTPDEVEAIVLQVQAEKEIVSLGIRQLEEPPSGS